MTTDGPVNAAAAAAKDTPTDGLLSPSGVPAGPSSPTDLATPTTGEGVGVASSPPRVIGLDLSLRSTGVAGGTWALTVTGPKLADDDAVELRWARLRRMRAQLLEYIDNADLVVLESPAYSKGADPGSHERAWLWWAVAGRCIAREVPLALVSPGTLKVYATGDGRATKEDVVQQVQKRRPDVTFRGNNEADALTLAALGLDHLGHPPVDLPKTHRRALDAVHWPAATS